MVNVMRSDQLKKYPRTRHIRSSGLQKGDDLEIVQFSELDGKALTVEAKIDGANTAISFSDDCELLLQSRGHYLVGGDWPEFDQFKLWGNTFSSELFDMLSNRYIMYGEWMAAFHSVFYDKLPHFFMEFDIYDKERNVYLDTKSRKEITDKCLIVIESVRVLETRVFDSIEDIVSLVGKSSFMTSDIVDVLIREATKTGMAEEDIKLLVKLNQDRLMEGLYLKWEEDGIVKDRYKYVRSNFVQTICDYGTHWTDRPTIYNCLENGKDLFQVR